MLSSGLNGLEGYKKREEKYNYKQFEKDCKLKLGGKNVYNQFSRLLVANQSTKIISQSEQQSSILNYMNQKVEKKTVTLPKSPISHLKRRFDAKEDTQSNFKKKEVTA